MLPMRPEDMGDHPPLSEHVPTMKACDPMLDRLIDELVDVKRDLAKARSVLRKVDKALTAEATMNAAKHLNDEVIISPLATLVRAAIKEADARLESEEI